LVALGRKPRQRKKAYFGLTALLAMGIGGTVPALVSAQTGPEAAPMPTLPPIWVLEPDFYDQNGCQLYPASENPDAPWQSYCGPREEEPDAPETKHTVRNLQGFMGPYYAATLTAQQVVLLQDSVTTATEGNWRAWGLVRNETNRPVGAVVTASLFGGNGELLDAATASVPVSPLRPGEPGPFALTSDVIASAVTRVEWSVQPAEPTSPVQRGLLIRQFWALSYGSRERASSYYSDPEGPPPYPFVLAGDVQNLQAATVGRPTVVAAWLDADLRVRWVTTAPAGEVPFNQSRAATFPALVQPRSASPFFLVVSDPTAGPLVGNLTPMLWASGT
jgi:hypothetical protein